MKSKLLVAMITLAMGGTAYAKENWQGELFITVNNPACEANGVPVGDHYLSQFFPSGISNNGSFSYQSFIQRRNAETIKVSGRPAATKAFTGVGVTGRGEGYTTSGTYAAFAVSPAAFTVATKSLFITGQVNNFRHFAGCNVSFEGSFIRRIN
jgi:hypothetical protein